jgi:hypothetical protein
MEDSARCGLVLNRGFAVQKIINECRFANFGFPNENNSSFRRHLVF